MQIIHNNLLSNQLCKWGFILGIFCEWAHVISPCKKTPLLHHRPDKQGLESIFIETEQTKLTRQKKDACITQI